MILHRNDRPFFCKIIFRDHAWSHTDHDNSEEPTMPYIGLTLFLMYTNEHQIVYVYRLLPVHLAWDESKPALGWTLFLMYTSGLYLAWDESKPTLGWTLFLMYTASSIWLGTSPNQQWVHLICLNYTQLCMVWIVGKCRHAYKIRQNLLEVEVKRA